MNLTMISTYTATKQRIWDRLDVPASLLDPDRSLLPALSYSTRPRLVNSQLVEVQTTPCVGGNKKPKAFYFDTVSLQELLSVSY
jgi:hypothetical protein